MYGIATTKVPYFQEELPWNTAIACTRRYDIVWLALHVTVQFLWVFPAGTC